MKSLAHTAVSLCCLGPQASGMGLQPQRHANPPRCSRLYGSEYYTEQCLVKLLGLLNWRNPKQLPAMTGVQLRCVAFIRFCAAGER